MPTINHTITVTIGGVDRTGSLLKDSLYIRTSIGNKGDECSFRLRDATGTLNVIEWQEVTVSVNGTAVFGGYSNRVNRRGVGAGSTKEQWLDVVCRDWSSLFDRIIVNRGYTDTADTDIIQDLFGTYLVAEAFDAVTNVFAVNADVDMYFENITFREALNALGTVCQAEWHVAPDKSLYWYLQTNPEDATFNIDVVSPNGSTTFDVLADTLTVNSDATAIVNRIRVIGGEEQTDKVTDTFTASGIQSLFGPLTKKPGSIWKITWTNASGIQETNWPSRIGYEPEDQLSFDGGDYNCLVNLESRHVTIKKTDGTVPKILTDVVVEYYALETVDVTVEDETSQASYGQVFEQTVYDDTLTNRVLAQDYGERVIAEYAFARETISFDVTEHGLLPGRLITIHAPVLGVTNTYNDALALETGVDVLLLENGDRLMLESDGETRKYLIQSVTLRTVVTGQNQFMVVASVQCGKYIPTLIDSLLTIRQFTGASGRLPAKRTIGRLDQLSGNLGDIIAGRAIFTDGGTAPFDWASYNDHTGIVVGLEDNGANAYGAMYILDDGVVKAKVGRMDGLNSVSGVSPTGWGIWTENGYFSGVIAASQMIGGTIATRAMPINSSNPGIYMTSAGLYAYGTLGLTFALPTDPAQRPIFSSGTILNTVYEVTTSSVLRTGTVNPRIQIDNSGIFAYDSGGTIKFSVNAATGKLTASDGTFSGTVTGSYITGGTVNAGGGTAVLDATGLSFAMTSGTAFFDPTAIKWKRSTTVAASLSGRYDGSSDYLWGEAGVSGAKNGEVRLYTWGTSTNNNMYYIQNSAGCNWWETIGGTLRLVMAANHNEIAVYKDVLPYWTYGTVSLGNSSLPFKYVFLKGDNGTTYRLSVNSSGVLTLTAV